MQQASVDAFHVGGLSVGEYLDMWGNELGAAVAQIGKLSNPAQLKPIVANLNNRALMFQRAAVNNPAVQALSKVATQASVATTAALQAAAQQRFKDSNEWLKRPTHVIPVPFDAVGAASISGVATISAPHDRSWRLLGIQVNDAQATGMRIVSFKIANTEHVITSNVAFSSGAPPSPGMDAAIFSTKMQTMLLPQYRWFPWALNRAGVIRSDGKIQIQVYNPGAAAASLNVSLFVQSSPCGDGDGYSVAEGGVLKAGSEQSNRFLAALRNGTWPTVS
jgi:hypothetical protein